ncbi:hypothetical protein HLRTI_001878 [Halorhabdus tiamatea SARL4B]|uniref:Uncharacterized protein n=1 Tax=Halorhabdus tiamatea SARL4B TaxID=1033806 RepID=F7PQC7_9EURY|nr:DUF5791 family protein [Halorhabdus tiamatea]ERJ06115.1 hypothetical protein HLRTI_001878 [Halorhabdus tiamatea SARL4B]CCQ33257.1 conserved hypothetical protein [Halorhabdus tiamatea SARL4B]
MLAAVDADAHDAASLRRAYDGLLADAIETAGVDAVVAGTALDADTVDALADADNAAETPSVTLSEASAVLALTTDRDADALAADARDRLLLELSSAVLDVEALSQGLGRDVTPKELQAKMEGRHPMTLAEYAEIRGFVAGKT